MSPRIRNLPFTKPPHMGAGPLCTAAQQKAPAPPAGASAQGQHVASRNRKRFTVPGAAHGCRGSVMLLHSGKLLPHWRARLRRGSTCRRA